MSSFQRWFQFTSFFIYMVLLGSVYTYSIYRPFIISYYDIRYVVSGYPYMVSLAIFAMTMAISSKYFLGQYIKPLIILATILTALGFGLASIAPSIGVFTLGYGVMVGIGVGLIYGLSLNTIIRLFTERIGLLSGIMLMGFGLSSVITSPLAQWVLSNYTLSTWFLVLAVLSIVIGTINLLGPSYDRQPLPQKTTVQEPYLGLLGLFTVSAFTGLMMIGLSGTIGSQIYNFSATQVSVLVSLFAIGNAGARPLFGYLMDRFGFITSMLLINGVVAVATVLNLFNQGSSIAIFGMSYFIYWFSLGAWLAIMPLLVKKAVGTEKYSAVYGKVFIGYGIAAVGGTLFSGIILDAVSNTTFIYLGILGLLVVITGFSYYLNNQQVNN